MDQELLKLHKIHGNKWAEIGRHVGTTGRACLDRSGASGTLGRSANGARRRRKKLVEVMSQLRQEHGGEGGRSPCQCAVE